PRLATRRPAGGGSLVVYRAAVALAGGLLQTDPPEGAGPGLGVDHRPYRTNGGPEVFGDSGYSALSIAPARDVPTARTCGAPRIVSSPTLQRRGGLSATDRGSRPHGGTPGNPQRWRVRPPGGGGAVSASPSRDLCHL